MCLSNTEDMAKAVREMAIEELKDKLREAIETIVVLPTGYGSSVIYGFF